MAKLTLYDTSIPRGQLVRERELAYLSLAPQKKLDRLLSLIRLSIKLNANQPLKHPQAKGILISRKND
jgi:hypothetical protein